MTEKTTEAGVAREAAEEVAVAERAGVVAVAEAAVELVEVREAQSAAVSAAELAAVFFFSSRIRHTRWNCDWSSDVCSSDLGSVSPCRDRGGAKFLMSRRRFD